MSALKDESGGPSGCPGVFPAMPPALRWMLGVRRHRRLLACVAGTLVVLFGLPVVSASPAAGVPAGGPRVPGLAWQDCGGGFDCATARVPLDYERPGGRTIVLALIRLPAADPARRIGSLFINPGGPGNSGVAAVRESARVDYTEAVRARFDIVGMDPRGVAASSAVRCFASESDRQQFFADYNVLPIDRQELAMAAKKVTELARSCQARAGWLLPHLSTANVARDLDLLRRAVGDRKLSYAGYSYGTYLGATYANLFPDKVRALVLDGVNDAPAYTTGPPSSTPFVRAHAHIGSSETLGQFFTLCAQAGHRCAFADGGDPQIKFGTLAQRLRGNPLFLPDGRRVGYAELVDLTVSSLYRAAEWANLASILQQLYAATNPAAAAAHLLALATPAQAAAYDNTLEALFANVCSETSNPADPFAYADLAARADRRAPYVGAKWTYLSLPCAVWPSKDPERFAGPWQVRTAAPALLLSTRFDPATPHRNAVHMAALVSGSRLVTVEGWGHTALATRSTCADRIVERYLIDQVLPPRGARCQPGIVPFVE
jgi:pimeloyl-ACP methyl ester carboxylesterase